MAKKLPIHIVCRNASAKYNTTKCLFGYSPSEAFNQVNDYIGEEFHISVEKLVDNLVLSRKSSRDSLQKRLNAGKQQPFEFVPNETELCNVRKKGSRVRLLKIGMTIMLNGSFNKNDHCRVFKILEINWDTREVRCNKMGRRTNVVKTFRFDAIARISDEVTVARAVKEFSKQRYDVYTMEDPTPSSWDGYLYYPGYGLVSFDDNHVIKCEPEEESGNKIKQENYGVPAKMVGEFETEIKQNALVTSVSRMVNEKNAIKSLMVKKPNGLDSPAMAASKRRSTRVTVNKFENLNESSMIRKLDAFGK